MSDATDLTLEPKCAPRRRRAAAAPAGRCYHPRMTSPSLLLASASPRRRRLLAWLGVEYAVSATDTPEDLSSPLRAVPPVLARSLAADKARAARDADPSAATVVACDTIVVLDRSVLGKPADGADARRMLRELSGRTHQVITGVAVLSSGEPDPVTFAVTTPVTMRTLDDAAIEAWLAEGEALGCAGAYNIERMLADVEPTECFQNVAGLPLCHLYERLTKLGLEGLCPPFEACDAARGITCVLGQRLCGARAR
jgi:septum formation protein